MQKYTRKYVPHAPIILSLQTQTPVEVFHWTNIEAEMLLKILFSIQNNEQCQLNCLVCIKVSREKTFK